MCLFSNLVCWIQELYDFPDSFRKFSDVLPGFTCASATANL